MSECISFYGLKQCHRKCKEEKCPGKVSGVCLSETGLGKQAPPENFSVNTVESFQEVAIEELIIPTAKEDFPDDSQSFSPGVVNLAVVTGIKGAFF